MAEKKSLSNAFMTLPWIAQLLIAIFADIVLGVCRLVDGIFEGSILKIIIGILWLFYGFGIGWVLDIVFIILKKRPLFF